MDRTTHEPFVVAWNDHHQPTQAVCTGCPETWGQERGTRFIDWALGHRLATTEPAR